MSAFINGNFIVGGYPIDGATGNLYLSTVFTVPPTGGNVSAGATDLPDPSNIQATCITGPANGSNGAYRFTVASSGSWWVGVKFAGYTSWFYHSLPGSSPTWFNVKDYGALGTGLVDESASINSAIASANSAGGGVVYFPPGKYACNLTILNDNVTLQGDSHTLATNATNCLVPFATGSPVIKIGVDVNRISDGLLRNLTIAGVGPNGRGLIGLQLLSPQRWNFSNVFVTDFLQNCVLIQGGFTQPAELCWFDQCQFSPNNNCTDAGVTVAYPISGSQWTTDIFFDNCEWYSPTNTGYAMKIDGMKLYVSNSFLNAHTSGGIKYAKSNAAGPDPFIVCNNFELDSGNGTDVLISSHTSSLYVGSFLNGIYDCNGLIQNNAGATLSVRNLAGSLGDRFMFSSAYAVNGLSFGRSVDQYNTNHLIQATSQNFQIITSGSMQLEHGAGKSVQILDNVNGLPATIQAGVFLFGNTQSAMISNIGSPEAATGATTGSIYLQRDGDPGRVLWTKITGGGSTGWRPITEHVPYRAYTVSSASGTVSIAIDDQVVGVNATSAAKVQLPSAPAQGRLLTIKDVAGNAGGGVGNQIMIYANQAGVTMDGAVVNIITTNYGKVTMVYDGTNWFVIG